MNEPEKNQQAVLAKGLFYLGIFLLLGLLLVWFFEGKLSKLYNPNTHVVSNSTQKYHEVILQRNAYSHYVSSGKINGQAVELFLDTGATSVSIPEKTARQLNLKKGQPYSVSTANGMITVYATKLDSIEIGNIRLNNIRASINPHSDKDILLGMSFLKHLDFAQQGEQLILKQYIN